MQCGKLSVERIYQCFHKIKSECQDFNPGTRRLSFRAERRHLAGSRRACDIAV